VAWTAGPGRVQCASGSGQVRMVLEPEVVVEEKEVVEVMMVHRGRGMCLGWCHDLLKVHRPLLGAGAGCCGGVAVC